ncbi:MAG: ParB/RepB/Spo0J family partition protein [Candidatus Carbobacillus sp.]|nr:ParB/RepB/Spo0J family partition protein [Candidatus Carbobacillus sp.]
MQKAQKRTGLGRGLEALIPELNISEEDRVQYIALADLRPNPFQPRQTFDEEALMELAESIKQHGVLQPILVRPAVVGYEIIAGERRWRAAGRAGLTTIPAVVRSFDDDRMMEVALIENIQRASLTPLEIARGYQRLIDTFQLTQEELATKMGQSRSHIANYLRLLTLPQVIQEDVSRGTLSMGHAKMLVGLDEQEAVHLAQESQKNNWSVRMLERVLKERRTDKTTPRKQHPRHHEETTRRSIYFKDLERKLEDALKTRVRIIGTEAKGKVEIDYLAKEDLERILNMLIDLSTREHRF